MESSGSLGSWACVRHRGIGHVASDGNEHWELSIGDIEAIDREWRHGDETDQTFFGIELCGAHAERTAGEVDLTPTGVTQALLPAISA